MVKHSVRRCSSLNTPSLGHKRKEDLNHKIEITSIEHPKEKEIILRILIDSEGRGRDQNGPEMTTKTGSFEETTISKVLEGKTITKVDRETLEIEKEMVIRKEKNEKEENLRVKIVVREGSTSLRYPISLPLPLNGQVKISIIDLIALIFYLLR